MEINEIRRSAHQYLIFVTQVFTASMDAVSSFRGRLIAGSLARAPRVDRQESDVGSAVQRAAL